jgi:hypothetical protein
MPKNTRNFWVELDVDGQAASIKTGPRNAAGGFKETVYVRGEGGTVETAVRITGEAFSDGELRLYVTPGESQSWGTGMSDWPESMKIEPYELDGGGFGFRITSKR